MSGIFGFADTKQRVDIRRLTRKMSMAMSYRNWFVTESSVDDESGVSIGRIGIGIFNQVRQPLWNSSNSVALVMAGELYKRDSMPGNNASLTDEQFVLALYEELGEGFASILNGAFIIGIYDKGKNCVLIVNDRFGLYPHYYACRDGRLIFSPEVKGILCDETIPQNLDMTALAQYVRFQHLLGERTFFEDISLLPPGSILRYDITSATYTLHAYWTFNDIPYRPKISFNEAVDEVGHLFRQAVKSLSSDSYRLGVYLSGGLDSRSILGMIDRRPVISITYGAPNCRDVFFADRTAKAVRSDHHWFNFPNGKWVEEIAEFHLELTEGFHSWIHAHGMSTLAQARELIDVNLSGWDGGTIMGDKDTIEPLQLLAVDDFALVTRLYYLFNQKFTWPSITEGEENLLYSENIWKNVQGLAFDSFRDELRKYLNHRSDVRGGYFYIRNSCRRLTQNMIVFARSHFEVRFPFFDYDLFNFLYSLPASLRGQKVLYRAMIQREMPRLAYIPYDHDEFLPTTQPLVRGAHAEVVKFKRRFNRHIMKVFPERHPLYADYEAYLRNELRGWAENILYDRRTVERGIFEPSFVRSLMNRHLSGLEKWTIGKIAPLITYEMMLRRYYD